MLAGLARMFKKPWFLKIASSMAGIATRFSDVQSPKLRELWLKNKELYETKERRILDAITMRREPDKVPAVAIATNFFAAKYAGITCADFMFDAKKMRSAFFKMDEDFNFDSTFTSFMLGIGRILTAFDVNLFLLPGRDVNVNSSYQYNEFERLKQDEYDDFLEGGIKYLMDTLAPRFSDLFKANSFKKISLFGRVLFEGLKFGQVTFSMMNELKARGSHNIFGGAAIAPFDLMSFAFRTMGGVAKDMMKKQTQEKLIEVCERMEPYMTSVFSLLPKASGNPGIFFVSERAFSLSPRQFEKFYWPTLKKIIVTLARDGNIPFLLWEQDTTHLVHFLLELPKSISRRCVFLCDSGDIYEINKILDGHICIQGNIPLSTMCVGTPKDVEKYCAQLFKELKPGGGFMLSPALGIPDEAKPENVHAYINYAEKHGWY